MPSEYEFDVFISYSHKDEEWVEKTLVPRLEKAGLKVCIDFRHFELGKPALHNMRDAYKYSQRTLLVMTPNWVASAWALYEGILVRSSDPAGLEKRTIPLLLEKCDIPEDISILTYVDFTRADRETLAWRQLLTALGAPPEPEPPKVPQRDNWFLAHPYPMPPNFTGRLDERAMLTGWLDADAAHPLLVLRALGGFGKSALAWHWLLHDVTPAACPRVVWWSFYEGDASFDHFLGDTLPYLGVKQTATQSLSAHEQVEKLLQLLHTPGALLILDGFERVLRAFGGLDAAYQGDEAKAEVRSEKLGVRSGELGVRSEELGVRSGKSESNDCDCISPLAELFLRGVATLPNLRSKVLLTTRLFPRVLEAKGGGFLEGCRDEELDQMQPADAVAFFRAQGIRGTHTEIELACAPYGYHPLSLRLLAGLIVRDFQQPGDIAAAKRLDVSGDLVQRQHHVLETAYDSLMPQRQALLGRIACFRGPVKYDALKALAETEKVARGILTAQPDAAAPQQRPEDSPPPPQLDADLHDLVARELLHHDTKEGRFDLHPIVRRYAYDRLAAPERAAAHTRLRDYFAAVPKPDKVTRLEDLAPVIELYHHTVRAGQFDEALRLFHNRIWRTLYYQLGGYQLQTDLLRALFPDGEDRPPRLKDESAQAWTLNELANSCSHSGQPRRAVPLFERQIVIREKRGNKRNLATGLGNVATQQLVIGALRAAEANLRRRIALCREIKDEFSEAVGHDELGWLLAYRGAYAESETELATALKTWEKQNDAQGQCLVWSNRALRELLRLRHAAFRDNMESEISDSKSALAPARRALELADEDARTRYPHARDYVHAHWLLGAAHRVAGQPDEAERHLHEALERCRRINSVDAEADILIDLARLRAATGAPDEAQRLAEEALLIAERSDYVLQGADARLELAKLALERNDKAAAREHAREARRLATCDGPPDYTYQAAYDEANALLEKLDPRR